ncbi:MAG: TIGR00303 family protein [Thermoplasmatales archaeon]
MLFILVIGNTEIANVKGITAAGENSELIKYTPPADAEFLFYDRPRCINAIPITPSGNPTPAIITKASRNLLNFPILVIRGGSIIEPNLPYVAITSEAGRDIRKQRAITDFDKIKERARLLADFLYKKEGELMIGESIPGGTTTAMAVLSYLGYDAVSSSSFRENPVTIKKKVVEESLERIRGKEHVDPIEELGDPVLATISYISFFYKGEISLAGGTQMLAVAAYLKEIGKSVDSIITTKYVVNDRSATFKETARQVGINYKSADIDLSISRFKGIRDYESGIVKEGVGAGGAYFLAREKGIDNSSIVSEIDRIYDEMTK